MEVVVVGDCQGRAECEIAIPSAFGDLKKPLSVEINLSKVLKDLCMKTFKTLMKEMFKRE